MALTERQAWGLARRARGVLTASTLLVACASGSAARAPASGSSTPAALAAEKPAPCQSWEASEIQKTVSAATPAIRQDCWQAALETRSSDAPTSARIVTQIQID